MTDNLILRVIAKLLIPIIVLFALYVQFHGDFGPGGGFQAGVIFSGPGPESPAEARGRRE